MTIWCAWIIYVSVFVFGFCGCAIVYRAADKKSSSRAERILIKSTSLAAGVVYFVVLIATVVTYAFR